MMDREQSTLQTERPARSIAQERLRREEQHAE